MSKLFLPTNGKRSEALLRKATKKNAEFDAIDAAHGNPTPAECGPVEQLRTAITAILAGMETEDWDCVAEGVLFVAEAELALRSTSQGGRHG